MLTVSKLLVCQQRVRLWNFNHFWSKLKYDVSTHSAMQFLLLIASFEIPFITYSLFMKVHSWVCSVPVAARSKVWVCGRSSAEIVGSNLTGGHGCPSVLSVVFCQVEVSATS